MIICVTGTPGTGKTTFSKKLAKQLKYSYVNLTSYIRKKKIHEGFDKNSKSFIVDKNKLQKALASLVKNKKNMVIDGHLSHYIKKTNLCFVMTCDLKTLKKRLQKRKYSKEKIRENLDAEIFQVCFEEAKRLKPILISSS